MNLLFGRRIKLQFVLFLFCLLLGSPVFAEREKQEYDAGKLLVGAFEPSAKPWGMEGISEDFCFDEIAGDFDHFEPVLHDAMKRLPALEQAGICPAAVRKTVQHVDADTAATDNNNPGM